VTAADLDWDGARRTAKEARGYFAQFGDLQGVGVYEDDGELCLRVLYRGYSPNEGKAKLSYGGMAVRIEHGAYSAL
jgi:hypothetical protein